MADNNKGGGPGTNVRGGVRSTMQNALGASMSPGSQENMDGTFNAPRTGGENGLPTYVTAKGIKAPSTMPRPTQIAPSLQGKQRPGTK